ncbi:DUF308 domain-containing protein [Pseudoduganella lutea]|uniref:DUF308 domain-containing protein n=2 Tax=Pseudoduganella lutea TaxID=321985 RepID=A0A4P6L726_9BURK|nr:DUF308 domain-containing protein [Pseudoduganella lutea]QBE67506.1 DUF308 domain-containing protein [Pseudoduganella lutea]
MARWLKQYYFGRALFAFAWIAAAVGLAPHSPGIAALLLVAYPAWDALANLADGLRAGGLAGNRSQALNAGISVAIAIAIAIALPNMHRVLAVFGAWAIVAGLLQLATALRRRKTHGAQWAMIASGAQSALAGAFFVYQAGLPVTPSIFTVTGYAGFGAFYFLVAGVALTLRGIRRAA